MNNKYFTLLFCITILAFAPACNKHQPSSAKAMKNSSKGTSKNVEKVEDVNTMIEIDNSIFELEDNEEIVITKKSISKF